MCGEFGCGTAAVEILLKKGMNVKLTGNGETPLLIAAQSFPNDMLALLIKKGADVNARNRDGDAPLHIACRRGCIDGVKLLLAFKADCNILGSDSRPPLPIASGFSSDLISNSTWCLDHRGKTAAENHFGSVMDALRLHGSPTEYFVEPIMSLLVSHGTKGDAENTEGCSALEEWMQRG